jgi:nitroreductase
MDLYTAIKERRSCRNFLPDPIDGAVIEKILDAAVWAPSPLNMQPWEFVVITNGQLKDRIYDEADRCRVWALEKTGWKWLGGYDMTFLKSAPVMIAVIGDPKKSGVDMFQDEGGVGYQHACAAAVQNLLLAAHAEGLGGLWFTFYDKKELRGILDIDPEKTPVALVCLGRPGIEPVDMPRKGVEKKVTYLR